MRFTVFTPTYNRASTLPRVYESLRRQTVRDFEWIVVDDGSTDGTETLVRKWQEEGNDFPIRYYWQPNQHKKVAFNRGVREARGQWFVCIDSDDELLPDALEKFANMWATIPQGQQSRYCAVVGLCLDDCGRVIGDHFPSSPLDADSISLWFDYGVHGDKLSCMRIEALREFPFPEGIPGLVPESVVWFRMAGKYTQRCFNIPVHVVHYDVESICRPSSFSESKLRNAQGSMLFYTEALNVLTWKRFLNSPARSFFLAVLYNRFSCYLPQNVSAAQPKGWARRLLVFVSKPAGWILYLSDRFNLTKILKNSLTRLGLRL